MKNIGSVATRAALAATLAATSLPAAGFAFADEQPEAPAAVAEASLADGAFPDVDYSEWYADGVAYAVDNGLMSGYDNGFFGIGDTLTRGQLATILWRLACPDEAASYDAASAVNATGMADVEDGKFYTAAANWAVSDDVINGFEEGDHREFRPDAPVTMEQLCCITVSFLGWEREAYEDNGYGMGYAAYLSQEFNDADTVSDWAFYGVGFWTFACHWANGYDSGDGTRSLRPYEALTRERAATMLANMDIVARERI